jgi:NTE family protein
MTDTIDRALVLAGGGVGGIAWLLGFADGLRRQGVDVTAADVLIGTSAGSAVAAQLATGQLEAAVGMQLSEQTSELSVQFDIDAFFAEMAAAIEQATDRSDASRRVANLPLVNTSATAEQRRAAVAARLPVIDWPDRDLRIVAVARDTGERAVFDRTSGVGLVDAVLASCAVPGVWRPVPIGDREYVDGGVHSFSNADLAAGAQRTLLLVPGLVQPQTQQLLDEEIAALAPGKCLVIAADAESVDAIGPNPLDPARRAVSYAAGVTQAERAGGELGEFWNAPG